MGIFEKSIPKYVVNPVNQNVEVVPQVYVDDIFDPLFNTNVRNAMRQKYGDGLYGIAGGYSEMLKNAWGGDGGILGKGMGVLSTFGRSMEKADDLVLGLLTEGVEGVSGQGFDNPFQQIFSEDKDYTGKRLLASTANIFRNLAGTSLTEEDFGTAWNVPALGIELTTDVGILGGGLARKFAPAAREFTSKQLIENLGKSDLKTSVGEVGQLMSNYDDLMTRVAIDATAPGLRPAFKTLKNRLGEYFATQSAGAWADAEIDLDIIEDEAAPLEARLQAQERLAKNQVIQQATALFKEADEKMAAAPASRADVTDVSDDIDLFDYEFTEGGAEEPALNRFIAATTERDLAAEAASKQYFESEMDRLRKDISDKLLARNRDIMEKFEGLQAVADKYRWAPKDSQSFTDFEAGDLDKIRKIVTDTVGGSWELLKRPDVQFTPDERTYLDMLDSARATRDTATESALATEFPEITESLYYKTNTSDEYVHGTGADFKGVNATYADEVMEKLVDDESLLDAISSGEWSTNDATNKEINKALHGLPFYSKLTSMFRVSPSRKSAVNAAGASGVSYAYNALQNVITKDIKKSKKLFHTPEELGEFLESDEVAPALEKFIPVKPLRGHAAEGLSHDELERKALEIASNKRRKFTKLLNDVYFPYEGISVYDYTKKLQELELFIGKHTDIAFEESLRNVLKDFTKEDRLRLAKHPQAILTPEKFLMQAKHLRPIDNSTDSVSIGAYYFLNGKHAPNIAGNPLEEMLAEAEAEALRKRYEVALKRVADFIKPSKRHTADVFFNKLYNAVDDIRMTYLQPIRDEMPRHLHAVDEGVSLDAPVRAYDGTSTTLGDVLNADSSAVSKPKQQFMDVDPEQSYSPSRLVSDWVRRTVPNDVTPDQFAELTRPLADYLDVGYKPGVTVPSTDVVKTTLDAFYKDAIPAIERLSSDPKYSNYYLGLVFAKDASFEKAIKKIPKNAVDDIRKLRTYVISHVDREVYKNIVKQYSPNARRFAPQHAGATVAELTEFFNTPKSPTEIISKFAKIYRKIPGANMSEVHRILDNVSKELGTTHVALDSLLKKAREKGSKALSPDELRLYRAYTQLVYPKLAKLPYTGFGGRKTHPWQLSSGYSGILQAVEKAFPLTVENGGFKQSADRTKFFKMYKAELDTAFARNKGSSDFFKYSKSDYYFIKDKIMPNIPADIRQFWKPSKTKGLFNFELPGNVGIFESTLGQDIDLRPERFQMDSFFKNFKGDRSKLTSVHLIDFTSFLTESGKESLRDAAARAELHMNLIPDETAKFVDIREEAFDRTVRSTSKNVSEATEEIREYFERKSPDEIAKEAYSPVSTASNAAEAAVTEVAEDMARFADNGGSDEAGESLYGTRKWRWFKQIKDAIAVSSRNSFRADRATTRTKTTSDLARRIQNLSRRLYEAGRFKDIKRFYILRQTTSGDVIKGSDFWTEFRRTGMLAAPYVISSKQLPIVEAALTKNAEVLNQHLGKGTVEVVTQDLGTTRKIVMLRFSGAKDTVIRARKAQKALDAAKFEDVVFSPPVALSEADRAFLLDPEMRELAGYMDELQAVAEDQARLLGFQFDNVTPYTHHAMRRDDRTARWLQDTFYNNLTSEDYDDITKLISNFDEYRKTDRGAFGTMLQGRRFRGDYWLFDEADRTLFTYDPGQIFTSTLADGMFANLQYQDFTDLFINDNFKIRGWFKTPEDLKKVLYATDSKGRPSGNLANSELVSYKLDENGRISGLIKYDKTTDAGLAKALADENTILVPANAVSHMDNVLRKDVRMGNKFWTFINKHFTIPFKFGLLSNPGFLLGNVSDSVFKLGTTMSQKYGTTFTEEAARVAECINASQVLKNNYYEAFDVWRKISAEFDIKLSPEARVPDIVAMSPKYNQDFLKWLDGNLQVEFTYQNEAGNLITEYRTVPCDLPKNVVDNASIWTMLQGAQMSSNKMREFAELADIAPTSRFDVPSNLFDRVTQGSGKYNAKDFRTWGLFMNNPAMKTMSDASGGWEDIIRTASILDDIRHGEYSTEDFAKFARGSVGTDESILMSVRLDEAKNTMFNAQFDYERQSDFISNIGKTVPFPIFFLKNFEYWMEIFNDNPQFIDNVIDVQEGLWSGYNEDNDKFMTEAKGRGAVPVGGDALPNWFKGVYKPSPLQSMFGAFNMLNDPVDNLSYRVNPLAGGAKAAVAQALPDSDLTTFLEDPESVKYRPYSGDMYERNIKQTDPNFNALEYTLHRANPFDRAMNAQLRIPEKAKANDLQMSDFLPSVFQPIF